MVVEAAPKSGALITVDHALDLGLEVFAVPGSVETLQAEGVNALIRDGAHLLTRGLDVLEVLGWEPSAARLCRPPAAADSDLARVAAAFGPGPRALDRLVPDAGLPVARVLAALTRLELNGSVARTEDGWSLTRQVL